MVGGRFGQQMLNLLVSSEEAATYLAKKFGVPDGLIRDAAQREQIVRAMAQMQGVANAPTEDGT